MRRECELKYRINNKTKDKLVQKLVANDFQCVKSNTETDFILDTEDRLCRDAGILFRIRIESSKEENQKSRIIITIKKKRNVLIVQNNDGNIAFQENNKFQDNTEIEFEVNSSKSNDITIGVEILKKATGCFVPEDDLRNGSVEILIKKLSQLGFSHIEILQKKRIYYKKNQVVVTIDHFPYIVGDFIEIETYNENDLYETVELLDLKSDELEHRSYGELILENTNGRCFFSDKIIYDEIQRKWIGVHEIIDELIKERKSNINC